VNFERGKIPLRDNSRRKCIYSLPAPVTAKHRAKFRWPPVSDVATVTLHAKMRNPLKFAGVPKTRQQISAASGPMFTIVAIPGRDSAV